MFISVPDRIRIGLKVSDPQHCLGPDFAFFNRLRVVDLLSSVI
jgi:hypothetical protein